MALKIQDAGTLRTITGLKIKQAGVLRTIKKLYVQDGGTLRLVARFADPLTVSATNIGGSGNGAATQTVTTPSRTATVAGGFSPFTYSWTLVSSGGGTPSTAGTPTMAATTFSKPNVAVNETYQDIWRVTVTDDSGDTATDTLVVTFSNFSTGGGFN